MLKKKWREKGKGLRSKEGVWIVSSEVFEDLSPIREVFFCDDVLMRDIAFSDRRAPTKLRMFAYYSDT